MIEKFLYLFRKPENKVLAIIKITGGDMQKSYCVPDKEIDAFTRLNIEMVLEGFDVSVSGMENVMSYSQAEDLLNRKDQLDNENGMPVISAVDRMMKANTGDNLIYR